MHDGSHGDLGHHPMLVDLAAAGTPTFGTDARRVLGAAAVLWAGEVEPDGLVKYTGVSNDRDPILQAIGGTVPTNSISGYLRSDEHGRNGEVHRRWQ